MHCEVGYGDHNLQSLDQYLKNRNIKCIKYWLESLCYQSGSILYISYSICLGLLFFQVMKNMTLNLAMFCKMSIWEWFWGLTHTLLSFNGLILETKELSTWIFKTRPYKLCIIMNYFFLLYGSYAIKSKLKWYII